MKKLILTSAILGTLALTGCNSNQVKTTEDEAISYATPTDLTKAVELLIRDVGEMKQQNIEQDQDILNNNKSIASNSALINKESEVADLKVQNVDVKVNNLGATVDNLGERVESNSGSIEKVTNELEEFTSEKSKMDAEYEARLKSAKSLINKTAKVNVYNNAHLRSGPGTDTKIIGYIKNDVEVVIMETKVNDEGTSWSRIGKSTWIASKLLK